MHISCGGVWHCIEIHACEPGQKIECNSFYCVLFVLIECVPNAVESNNAYISLCESMCLLSARHGCMQKLAPLHNVNGNSFHFDAFLISFIDVPKLWRRPSDDSQFMQSGGARERGRGKTVGIYLLTLATHAQQHTFLIRLKCRFLFDAKWERDKGFA